VVHAVRAAAWDAVDRAAPWVDVVAVCVDFKF
jgi:hypothetical protein